MHDCTITPANSDCIDGQNCGEPIIARVFFIVFIIVGQFMLLNLFIAVILDAFGSSEEDDDNCTEDDYEQFQQQWQRLDPEATVSLWRRLQHWPSPLISYLFSNHCRVGLKPAKSVFW